MKAKWTIYIHVHIVYMYDIGVFDCCWFIAETEHL